MMTRAKYAVFGDPAMFPIIASILLCSMAVKLLLTWIARLFGLWRIKYEKRSWHANVLASEAREPSSLDLGEPPSLDQHVMEGRITSETFRYKFLNYNRSWILSQLPDMITPRVTANQRPYMINQFARILGQINGNISSDSDSDDEPEFDSQPMTASTRTLARTWLELANRRLRLKKLVEPLIQQNRGNECHACLSRNLLQVETLHSLEDIDKEFQLEYKTEEIDQVLFRRFFSRHQQYQTICLRCIQAREKKLKEGIELDDRSLDDVSDNLSLGEIAASSELIMTNWYRLAQNRLR